MKTLQLVNYLYSLCSNLIYYTLKTNTAFRLYPVLLAVLSRCSNEVGNINHTRYTVATMLELVAEEVREDTVEWFHKEVGCSVL